MNTYRIDGMDPIIFGDGRPFSSDAGASRVRTSLIPMPTTLAGAFRSAYGRENSFQFTDDEVGALREMRVRGPMLFRDGEPLFPTPACLAEVLDDGTRTLVARLPSPYPLGAGSDLPVGLYPIQLPGHVREAFGEGKRFAPVKDVHFHYISLKELTPFLCGSVLPRIRARNGPVTEIRTHVGISPSSYAARKGFLFQTEGIRLGERLVQEDGAHQLDERRKERDELRLGFDEDISDGLRTIGGENRLSIVSKVSGPLLPCPTEVRHALSNAARVTMILATPACFAHGWRPDWLDPISWEGCPPSVTGVRLRLVGVACNRKVPVSGWDFRANYRRPKAVRWLVPSGSTYFFDVVPSGSAPSEPSHLADSWMEPVSDKTEDRNDGLGCALWGAWTPQN